MFYIYSKNRDSGSIFIPSHVGAALVVFVAFFGLTLWGTVDAYKTSRQNVKRLLDVNVSTTQRALQERVNSLEDILRAEAQIFQIKSDVNADDWQRFASTFQITDRYPGISGIGYTQTFSSEDKEQFVQLQQAQNSSFAIYPAGERAENSSVLYFAPLTTNTARSIGFDMYSDPARLEAMDAAQDTGTTTITNKLAFYFDDPANPQPAFVLFEPVYTIGFEGATTAERRAALQGFVYAPFRAQSLLDGLPNLAAKNYGFRLYEGTTNSSLNNLLYTSKDYTEIARSKQLPAQVTSFAIKNRTWTVEAVVDPSVLGDAERTRPSAIFWIGSMLSALVAGFIYLLLAVRTRIIAQRNEAAVQAAKDELLALASHQLRTPATGVKQYIDMLRDGYAGKLSSKQQKYLDKAYESNERQLGTINEMLIVARADAGAITLTCEWFNFNDIVTDVVEEQRAAIAARKHTITVKIPRTKTMFWGDQRYMRMAIENVLSNATKYTHDGGAITIVLKAQADAIHISVSDTGVGVSDKDKPLLFEKFSRIPNELTKKVSGSGIGLYLCKKIIQAHHGTITFTSQLHAGSTCAISVPTTKKQSLHKTRRNG